jgi:hypothetical protein
VKNKVNEYSNRGTFFVNHDMPQEQTVLKYFSFKLFSLYYPNSCFFLCRVAMDQLSGLQPSLLGHQQEVLSQGGSSGRSTPSSDSAPGKLFVGGLSWQTTQAQPVVLVLT